MKLIQFILKEIFSNILGLFIFNYPGKKICLKPYAQKALFYMVLFIKFSKLNNIFVKNTEQRSFLKYFNTLN